MAQVPSLGMYLSSAYLVLGNLWARASASVANRVLG